MSESIINNLDEDYLGRLVKEFKSGKETLELLEKRQNDMKKQLLEAVETFGYTDDKGHQWLKLGDHELKRERRVSRSLDTKAVEEWAKQTGHWDDVKVVTESVDEGRLLALAWVDKDLEETVTGFYNEKETWAFKA